MSDGNGTNRYTVTGMTMRQQSALDQNGRPMTVVYVSFSVGGDGPFTFVFPPNMATPEAIRDAVLTQVNAIKQRDTFIAQINSAL